MTKANRRTSSASAKNGENFLNQRRRNPPRVSVRGNIANATHIQGTELLNTITTNSSGAAVAVVPLIAGSPVGLSTGYTPLQSVAKIYNQFLFKTSHVQYIPSVGMTTPGNVTIAFINNSESMFYLLEPSRTISEIGAIVLGQANAVTHPIWHEFSYPMNLPARRKRFDVNGTSTILDVNTIERDCQGVFVIYVSGAPGVTDVAVPRRISSMLLEGLSSFIP
jgi:hypothetical protein